MKAPDLLKFAIFPEQPNDSDPSEEVFMQANLQKNTNQIESVSNFIRAELSNYFRQLNEAPLLTRNPKWNELYTSIRSKLKL
jgi:hypothetical protein